MSPMDTLRQKLPIVSLEKPKNKTAYLFLSDDNYYCEYFVDNSVSDKEAAAKQLKDFCHELSDIIVAAEGKS